ncbi:MAG: UDP-N-acetylmuramoyl-tripeptide--D-alanyl-D-alanine ligase [Bacteroidota bacterium]|nr:UDP-N-acetylmuramoyl-tripeptide--D-alanyl-D-alanine ligase [Bacteroidota bacterium]
MNLSIKDLLSVQHVAAYDFKRLENKKIKGISTDSRTIKAGELFFALRGDEFDGHAFVKDAFSRGAICAVIDLKADRSLYQNMPMLVVQNTIEALGQLANVYRRKFAIPFVAVAGSNGKTTVKQMIASVLGTRYNVLSTKGNLNNHIGVPQTLFRLSRSHEIAVVEIGTNHFGELKYLCDVLQPTHGLITNIGKEHLEFFKNIRGAARAEGELFHFIAKSGIGFVNVDDKNVINQAKVLKQKISYGFSRSSCRFHGRFVGIDSNGCAEFSIKPKGDKEFFIQLSAAGKNMMLNGLAAVAVGLTFGVSSKNIQKAIGKFKSFDKRMQVVNIGKVTILNDTYNSNPDSLVSSLETLKLMKSAGKKIAILADMLELGSASKKEHEQIGFIIKNMEVDYLLTYGEMARNIHENAEVVLKIHYEQKNKLLKEVTKIISNGDTVLVKGSRGMKMEEVVAEIEKRFRKKVI